MFKTVRAPMIETSVNYEEFNMAHFNRKLKDVTIKKLKAEYEKEDNFPFFPIIVDVNKTIIDGQHRFQACRELEAPVYYIVKDSKCEPRDVKAVNKAGIKHSTQDIYEMDLKIGVPSILEIEKLHNDLGENYALSVLLGLAIMRTSGGHVRSKLESGNLKIKSYEDSLRVGKKMIKLSATGKVNSTMHNAIFGIAGTSSISIEDLIDDLLDKGLTLKTSMSKALIVNKIAEVYNFKKKKANRIKL